MAEAQEKSELEAVSEQIEEQQSAEQQGQKEDDIPEKYRGKSLKDVISELETANRNMGRYANELGDVRKLADELIKSSLQRPKEQEVQPEVSIFENPDEAIRRAVESNPKVLAAEHYAIEARKGMALQRLAQLHPDYQKLASDQEFIDWVGQSNIRKQLYAQANGYDVDSANELFSTFKELKAAKVSKMTDIEKTSRNDAIKSAAVDSGGTGESSKKILRRADLMNLMIRDRRKYDSMINEIERAYAEGRVR